MAHGSKQGLAGGNRAGHQYRRLCQCCPAKYRMLVTKLYADNTANSCPSMLCPGSIVHRAGGITLVTYRPWALPGSWSSGRPSVALHWLSVASEAALLSTRDTSTVRGFVFSLTTGCMLPSTKGAPAAAVETAGSDGQQPAQPLRTNATLTSRCYLQET